MLNTRQVAAMFEVNPRTVIRWIREGRLEAYQAGRNYRIPAEAVEKFKNKNYIGGKENE